MQTLKIKPIHRLIASLILAIFVFIVTLQAVPKPKTLALILMFVPILDVWIDYWIRLQQRTTKLFLWIFYASIVGFCAVIIGFLVTPLAYWTPVLRVYGYGAMLITVALKIFLANFLFLHLIISKSNFFRKIVSPKRWFQTGIILLVLMISFVIYGSVYEVFDLRVRRIELKDGAVPKAFDGYKIVQFSDMHIGSQVSKRYVKKLVDSINAQNPDLVVFTGDMVNFFAEEIVPFVNLFSQIQAKDGVFVVFGNHDYSNYLIWKTPKDSADDVQRLRNIYRAMDWRILSNKHVWLHRGNDSIALAGVENYSSKRIKRWRNLADTEKALKGILPSDFIVMISHNPEHFNEVLQIDYPHVNLTLTGHSHGGQMAIGVGKYQFTVARFAMKHWRGFHQFGGQYLNVNTGCGFNALPFRINMAPSISVVELRTKS